MRLQFFLPFSAFLLMLSFRSSADTAPMKPGPDTVKVGCYVLSLHDINFREKEYTMRFWLWYLYDNPDFDFVHQLDIPNAKSYDPPEALYDTIDGTARIQLKMKATMKESWSVTDFPFDKQHLKVQVENTLFDRNSLVFLPDTVGSTYDAGETIDGWTVTDFKVSEINNDYQTGFGDPDPEHASQNFSAFLIEMDLERNAWGLFLKIFIGMYIAFLISMISFTIHPSELEPRFGLPVGGLFATVGNKYIIDSILPESSTFTLVDSLHTLTFLAIFGTLVFSSASLKFHDKGDAAKSLRINRIGVNSIAIIYTVANLVLIGLAIL